MEIETTACGSALISQEPALKGEVLLSVSSAAHGDRRRLYACACGDQEHLENLSLPQVKELDEKAAAKRAAEYQPERAMPRTDPEIGVVETLQIPACDLRSLLGGGQTGAIGGELLREAAP
ncbi:MAG: hypothetical protein PHD43_18175 [Methylococcales bacterium]|nr:hypothetical protein [Methylococcales bacterium]